MITWLRGGISPQVWGTTLDRSTDGIAWTSLGAGMPVSAGRQVKVVY